MSQIGDFLRGRPSTASTSASTSAAPPRRQSRLSQVGDFLRGRTSAAGSDRAGDSSSSGGGVLSNLGRSVRKVTQTIVLRTSSIFKQSTVAPAVAQVQPMAIEEEAEPNDNEGDEEEEEEEKEASGGRSSTSGKPGKKNKGGAKGKKSTPAPAPAPPVKGKKGKKDAAKSGAAAEPTKPEGKKQKLEKLAKPKNQRVRTDLRSPPPPHPQAHQKTSIPSTISRRRLFFLTR